MHSISVLSRCLPDPVEIVHQNISADVAGIVEYLNGENLFSQILSDFYNSWIEILALCLVALGKSFPPQ